jgi:alginate export protein
MFKRLMILLAALALMVGIGAVTTAQATDVNGSMVFRWEGFDNQDLDSDMDDAYGMSQLRTRVGFGGDVGDNAAFMLMIENYRVLGEEDSSIDELYQATFTVRDFLFDDYDVTFGRMPVAYGRERILGDEEWSMNPDERMIFEGYHSRYSFENGWFDFFNFKLNESHSDRYDGGMGDANLAGFYMHYDANESFWFEPYTLMTVTDNYDVAGAEDYDNDKTMTFGALVDYVHNGLHFYGEATVLSGTEYIVGGAETDISALGWYGGLFYDFDSTAEPFIGFEYNFASGDEADSADEQGAFSSPYGSSRDYLGIMNLVEWSNVKAMRFAGGFMPVDGLDVGADFFVFDTEQEITDVDTRIGTELDITLDYMLNEDVDLHGGFGMFSFEEGDIADKDTASNDAQLFGWMGASVNF